MLALKSSKGQHVILGKVTVAYHFLFSLSFLSSITPFFILIQPTGMQIFLLTCTFVFCNKTKLLYVSLIGLFASKNERIALFKWYLLIIAMLNNFCNFDIQIFVSFLFGMICIFWNYRVSLNVEGPRNLRRALTEQLLGTNPFLRFLYVKMGSENFAIPRWNNPLLSRMEKRWSNGTSASRLTGELKDKYCFCVPMR